jgi:sensor histidine kinase regulating citrate/malate metabolism
MGTGSRQHDKATAGEDMSKIYDALIKLEKKRPRSRIAFSRRRSNYHGAQLSLCWKDISQLEWRMIAIIGGMILIFGLLLVAMVNHLFGRALRTQIDQRALLVATTLSDAAAGHVIGRNTLELHALVTKYARLDGSAYAFIQDSRGQIVAHSLRSFPPELRETVAMNERSRIKRRVVTLQGRTVYETRTPILEGQVGAAHIGIWGESVASEIYSALLPITGLITILLLPGAVLLVFSARGIIRWLTDMAGTMTMGDLETPVKTRVTG